MEYLPARLGGRNIAFKSSAAIEDQRREGSLSLPLVQIDSRRRQRRRCPGLKEGKQRYRHGSSGKEDGEFLHALTLSWLLHKVKQAPYGQMASKNAVKD